MEFTFIRFRELRHLRMSAKSRFEVFPPEVDQVVVKVVSLYGKNIQITFIHIRFFSERTINQPKSILIDR